MIIELYCLLNKENEPGVDNLLMDTPKKRWETLKNLNLPDYKAKPLKRIYIPKKNGKKRPLGIPAMHDRVEQALDLLGLEQDEVKISCPVLRGLGTCNSPRLPDISPVIQFWSLMF